MYTAVDSHAGCYTVNRISLAADDLRKQCMSSGSKPEESVIIDQRCFQLLQQLLAACFGYYFIYNPPPFHIGLYVSKDKQKH